MYGMAIFLSLRTPVRQKLQRQLGNLVDAQGARAAAAGIAGLIGNCSAEAAIIDAKLRFRSIRIDQLVYADFNCSPTETVPREGLFERTSVCSLGHCDAFVSHSWHDPKDAKWNALQQWRQVFVSTHGREPTIWFDKACINQNDIAADLRGLPIFLSACSEMLVLCGPTYLSRLWCIVELFTFVHMGGDVSKIRVVMVARKEEEAQDMQAINKSIANFRAEQCSCLFASDKERMISMIMAAFGDMDSFDTAVRAVIDGAGFFNEKVHRK